MPDRKPRILLAATVAALASVAAGATAAGESAAHAKAGDFDAKGRIACVQRDGLPIGTCTARVARGPAGEATLEATFENGFARMLFFEEGAFLRANTTMSGVGTDTDWRLEEGMLFLRVDDQRFEVPEALVFGD
ncbi:hypothetical protein SAMN05421759_10783 [Roseivivax lentus]|uniref:Membrane-bound lysozyme-inhibitor of c-type lysozyme n=1 Tax=Roseivivax lentus TaxID=633194 RepID=A0A1N7N8T9_9RHOB|nr:hypothetical protein [Roseivivax lentus]SIS94783.1 hypothetical protein SAMN05421759_10783 [Roseivivax lentus]